MTVPPQNQETQPQSSSLPIMGRVPSTGIVAPRIVVNAIGGWGKTTLGAYSPNPAILMATGETGYVTLRGAGLCPDVDCTEITTWNALLGLLDSWTTAAECPYKTIVLDALAGFEKLCHTVVCNRECKGDWGEKGFLSYHKGFEMAINDWLLMLTRLDRVRAKTGATILLLSHSQVRPFKNPLGPDYDRFVADCHEKTWAATAKWADAVLFGTFFQSIEVDKKNRVRGIGGSERVLYTTNRDAWVAKNRYGMPEVVDMPDKPEAMWSTLWAAIRGGKK